MEIGEVTYEKVYASPRPPPKISLKHDWMKHLGSEVAQRPEAQVQQSNSSQSNQPNPNPDHDDDVCHDASHAQGARKTSRSQEIETRSFHEEAVKHDRTGTPVVCRDASHAQGARQTRSSDESTNFNYGDETNHDRTWTPVVCRDKSHAQGHEQSMLNEVNIDFRMPGLPHSVVKQAENSRARELVKQIENHPHRQDLQADLQQNKAYNPFSTTTKQMIQDVGNAELFELFETDPETQCRECLSYWSEGIVYCTCGHFLKEIVANRGFIEYTSDFLSIPEYVNKK